MNYVPSRENLSPTLSGKGYGKDNVMISFSFGVVYLV